MALTDKLTAIADAIRIKTGKTDSMTLEQMPTEIESITGSDITLIDNIDITPDFSNGNYLVAAAEGYAVKGATILKPDTLIPENIAEGVEIAGVVGTMEAGSSADVRYVTFMNGDVVLYKKPVAVGDDCVDVLTKGLIETPTKESTVQYDYTYYGWGASDGGAADADILKNITEDKTVYAIFTATVRTYTITYLDDDGVTVLHTESLAYGTVPSYTPTKEGYMLSGWNPSVSTVTGNATYTAVWEEVGVKWKIEDGTLTIYGEGAMDDYVFAQVADTVPWYSRREEITSIVIEPGITAIGTCAFKDCTNATSVTIPSTVATIGNNAFRACSSLTSVELPDGITAIAAATFYDCTNLASVAIPSAVTEIGNFAFQSCALTSVVIPNSVESIGVSAFSKCTALESVTIGTKVSFINQNAFNGCTALISATFLDTTTWKADTNASHTGGNLTTLTVTDKATAATYLRSTYATYYWKKT